MAGRCLHAGRGSRTKWRGTSGRGGRSCDGLRAWSSVRGVDHLTAEQCVVTAQTIPLLFIIFIAERELDRTPIRPPFNWLLVVGAAFLTVAEALAFRGINGGLTGSLALVLKSATGVVLLVLFVTLSQQILRKPPNDNENLRP